MVGVVVVIMCLEDNAMYIYIIPRDQGETLLILKLGKPHPPFVRQFYQDFSINLYPVKVCMSYKVFVLDLPQALAPLVLASHLHDVR